MIDCRVCGINRFTGKHAISFDGRALGSVPMFHKRAAVPPPPPGPQLPFNQGVPMFVPITRTPLSREKDIPLSRALIYIGNYKRHPISRAFSGKLTETTPPKYPFHTQKWKHVCDPFCIRGGGGLQFTIFSTA